MAQQEFLDELSDEFPPLQIYSFDENFRYETERLRLMDEVLEGTFETYSRVESEFGFRYTIIADAAFELEVAYKDNIWRKSFSYIAEAFDIAEAAYRFLIVVPRVLDEGEVVIANEDAYQVDEESRRLNDHCEDQSPQLSRYPA